MNRWIWPDSRPARYVRCAGALVLVAALVGGLLLLREHRRESELAGACGGVFGVPEARALLGDGPYGEDAVSGRTTGDLDGRGASLRSSCTVEGLHDVTLSASVDGVPARGHRHDLDGMYPKVPGDLPAQPLGHGWNGLFSSGESLRGSPGGELVTAVLLDCRAKKDDLLVTVRAEPDRDDGAAPVDDPRERTRYARVATAAAAHADDHWGCGARTGKTPRDGDIALPVGAYDDVPLDDAKGTCAGIPGRGRSAARAWESARGRPGAASPLETCVLGTTEPTAAVAYRFEALYGPYAQAARADHAENDYTDRRKNPATAAAGRLHDGGHWASATCPGSRERALFTVRPPYRDPLRHEDRRSAAQRTKDRAWERAALKSFAQHSATTHTCTHLHLP